MAALVILCGVLLIRLGWARRQQARRLQVGQGLTRVVRMNPSSQGPVAPAPAQFGQAGGMGAATGDGDLPAVQGCSASNGSR